MRVGVDATAFRNRHGDGRFARNAVRRLVELDGETRYELFHARPPSVRGTRRPLDLVRLARAARTGSFDAFLFPSLVSWFPAPGVPAVLGIHDANVARFGAELLPTRRARAAWRLKQSLALRRAARLFTVSEAARAELALRLGLDPERLEVVPQAPDPVFSPREPAAARAATAHLGPLAAAGFLLYASGINPHKGVETLVDACAELRDAGRPCPPLVLVGPLEDDEAQSAAGPVRERIAQRGLGDCVLLPGFVDDETLASLYSTATAAVVTSRAEGFGLPAIEAAACGAPVVLSDIPAHRESMGDSASYFPPGDSSALAPALSALVADEPLRRELAGRARRRVAQMSWDGAAHALRRLLEAAASERWR